jgi:hypothetical protein
MRLAVSILVFWLGMACVYIAFHGFTGQPTNFAGAIEQIPDSIHAVIAGQGPSALSGAWTTQHAAGEAGSLIGQGAQALAQGSSGSSGNTGTSGTVISA